MLNEEASPAYLDRLLLASGIISGCSGLFNITAVQSHFPLSDIQSTLFRGSKGKIRRIRRHGTAVPDAEKGSISGRSVDIGEVGGSPSPLTTFKNAFRRADQDSPSRPMQISRPIPNNDA
jgi:hypothetical protein